MFLGEPLPPPFFWPFEFLLNLFLYCHFIGVLWGEGGWGVDCLISLVNTTWPLLLKSKMLALTYTVVCDEKPGVHSGSGGTPAASFS